MYKTKAKQILSIMQKFFLKYRERILMAFAALLIIAAILCYQSCKNSNTTAAIQKLEVKKAVNKEQINANLSEQRTATIEIANKATKTETTIKNTLKYVKTHKCNLEPEPIRDTTYDAMRAHLDTVQPAP